LAEYRLFRPEDVRCWRAGTGMALADWLVSRGHTPRWFDLPARGSETAS
jgi:NAD+ diphosphatase